MNIRRSEGRWRTECGKSQILVTDGERLWFGKMLNESWTVGLIVRSNLRGNMEARFHLSVLCSFCASCFPTARSALIVQHSKHSDCYVRTGYQAPLRGVMGECVGLLPPPKHIPWNPRTVWQDQGVQ